MHCPVRPAALALALGVLLATGPGLVPAQALGQGDATGAPRPIGPDAPVPAVPQPPAPPAAPPPFGSVPGVPGPGGAPGVEVGTLSEVDSAGVGLLGDGQGGLGRDMWAGTPRETITRLLPRLPVATTSPVMNRLARRLLLTAAEVPPPATGETLSILDMRFERLIAGGSVADIPPLAAQVLRPDARLSAIVVDAYLSLGDDAGACGAASAPRLESNEPYWLRIRGYCYAVEENHPGVSLTLQLMENQGVADETYAALARQIAEALPAKIVRLKDPAPVTLALLRRTKLGAPADVLEDADPAALRALALLHPESPEVQLAAAQAAAEIGAVPVETLAALLRKVPFKATAFRDVGKAVSGLATPQAFALHLQAVGRAKDNAGRARAAAAALDFAQRRAQFPLMARLLEAELARTIPALDLVHDAPEMIRALMIAGHYDRARDWAAVLEAAETVPEALAAARIRLAIAAPSQSAAAEAGEALEWLAGEAERRGPQSPLHSRLAREAGVMDALGFELPPDVRFRYLQGPVSGAGFDPADALLAGLEGAGANGRKGEAVLLALTALGAQGPGNSQPGAIVTAVAALNAADLEAEARALALEALLALPFER